MKSKALKALQGETFSITFLKDPARARVQIFDSRFRPDYGPWYLIEFEFPPNDQRFLDEFVRAQNFGLILTIDFEQYSQGTAIIVEISAWGNSAYDKYPNAFP